jgi:hypothetical protein
MVALVVLNFIWSPYRSEKVGNIGMLGFATCAGAGLLFALLAYPFVGGKK